VEGEACGLIASGLDLERFVAQAKQRAVELEIVPGVIVTSVPKVTLTKTK
jgi:hypothetical protein